MNKLPIMILINMLLILVNAVIWLAMGVILAFNLHPAMPDIPAVKLGMAIISFILAGFLILATYMLHKHHRVTYYLVLIYFIGVSLLTITDQFGWADAAFLVISIVPAILLIINRKWYLQSLLEGQVDPTATG